MELGKNVELIQNIIIYIFLKMTNTQINDVLTDKEKMENIK